MVVVVQYKLYYFLDVNIKLKFVRKFNNMEVKQEASEISCKMETDNETFDGPLDAFKVEIKEEPKTEPAYDTFGYLDCNEFPLKTEVEQEQDECKFTPSETKQTANESCSYEENKMKSMETLTAHSSHTGSYTGRHAEGKPLNKNMKAVTARRPGKCEICFKRFSQACNLKLHLRVHIGDRPYTCEICFKQFKERGHLKRHWMMHTEEKPHKCEIYFKQFSEADSLKRHLRVHAGEKPYTCETCFNVI
ncbi:zinc finger and BTB domain-containing protein 49-like isoform X4 [Diabrotica virgifera virgifera]|uniref:C2H2-type domain-containing protein n=1 Tax=Diabrotica virgifera virgifera TaxID=50390 RepID=A0ABM5KXA3_DIAVI|nr:zinc finger and BTB domain-containing protein 49-like isoform X4 [Diabrotica virgifera virgifera]